MRGFELNRIVEILWKTPAAVEERTPIVRKKNTLTDNGTIPMDQTMSSDDIFQKGKKFMDDSIESRKEEECPQPMSLLRKLCFFLSLNGGVMYVVVMAWLLPCRLSPCLVSEDTWTTNLTTMQLTTNIETDSLNNPSFVIFGYSDGDGEKLGALRISDGKQAWNRTLPAQPRHVFCSFNGYGTYVKNKLGCLITADNFIAAFDGGSGNMIWERNITSDQRISKVSLTHEIRNKTFLIGISNDYMHLIDPENGTELSTVSLPCSWITDVKTVGPWLTKKGYIWVLVCEYNDGIEVFTFKEKELLNFSRHADDIKSRNDVKFTSLFSQQSYSGSIDLASDVTTTPHSLVLSWAEMVSMVTAQAPFHHLRKTWERRFSSPHGYTVDVTSVTTGHFVSSKSIQIAVAVQDGSNSTIHIVETKNGSSIAATELGDRSVLSVRKITGPENEKDFVLIETVQFKNSSNRNAKKDEPMTRSYFILQYEDNKAVFRAIATAEGVFDSSLSAMSKGNSNLLLARINPNGGTIVNRLVIRNRIPEKSLCEDANSKNTSTVMYLE